MNDQIRVLFVDNEIVAREYLAERLRLLHQFHVDCASNDRDAISTVQGEKGNYHVMLLDLRLGNDVSDGITVMKHIQSIYPDIETIIFTGFGDEEDGMKAMEAGAFNYVFKPLDDKKLAFYIRSAAERHRLKSIEHELDWLQKVLNISQVSTRSLDPEEVARVICEQLARQIPFLKLFYIAHNDQNKDKVQFLWAVDADRKIEMEPRILGSSENCGLAGYVLKTGKTLFVPDVENNEELRAHRFNTIPGPTRACISIPLISRDQLIGVLSAQSRQPGVFNQDHFRLLQAIANHTAVALDNAIQHKQTARQLNTISRLYETMAKLRSGLDLAELMDLVVGNLHELFNLDTCTLGLFDNDLTKISYKAERGLNGRKVERQLKDGPIDIRDRICASSELIEVTDVDHHPGMRKAMVRQDLRSFVIIPLYYKHAPIGIINLGSTNSLSLSPEEKHLLRTLGDQTATAVENAKSFKETQIRAQQLERLLDQVAHAIANEREIPTLLRTIATKITDFLDVAGSGVYLLTTDKQHFCLEAATGMIHHLEGRTFPADKGVIGKVYRDRKPCAVSNYWQWEERIEIFDSERQTAVMGAPIYSGNEFLGVLVVHDVRNGRIFNNVERDLLYSVGKLAGIEIEKVRIMHHNQQLLEERNATHDVTQALIAVLNYDQLLKTILEKLSDRFGYNTCAVLLEDPQKKELYIERAINYPPEIVRTRRIKTDGSQGGVTAWVFRHGEPKNVPDIDNEPLYIKSAEGSRSELAVPLIYRKKTMGVLNVESRRLAAFDDHDVRILTQAAASIATAIKNARLFDRERNKTKALKRLSSVGKIINSTLDLDQILDKFARYGRELLNAEVCTVFLVRKKGYLRLEANAGSPAGSFDPDLELEIKAGEGVGLTGHIAAEGKLINLFGEQMIHHPAIRSRQSPKHIRSGHTHALLGIPLKQRVGEKEEVIGLIKVENKRDRNNRVDHNLAFDGQDELILKTLAGYAETAIRNAKLYALANALQEVSRVVNSSLDIKDVLEKVFLQLRKLLQYDSASIQLKTGDRLQIEDCDGFNEDEKRQILQYSFPINPDFPQYEVVTTRLPLLISDVLNSSYSHFNDQAKAFHSEKIRTWLATPLIRGEEVIGVLTVESMQSDAYNSEHLNLCTAFANQIVSAIINAKSYKSAQSLNLLCNVQDIEKRISPDDILKRIVDGAVDKDGGIGADIAFIYPYNPDTGVINEMPVYAGKLKHPDKITIIPNLRGSVVYRILNLRALHTADDVVGDRILDRGFVHRESIASAAGIPLLAGDEPVGVMFVNFLTRHVFTQSELRLMNLFAQQAAISIRDARQYERLESASNAVISLAAMSAWAHDAANETYSLRADAMSLADLIADSNWANPKVLEILARVKSAAEKVAMLIPGMPTDFSKKESLSLGRIIGIAIERRAAELRKKRIEVNLALDDLPHVNANQEVLLKIADHLIQNAIKAMPQGGNLSFSGYIAATRIYIKVTDTGYGIPESLRDHLFRRRVPSANQTGGGIGLLLTRIYLLACDGDISLESSSSDGTTFIFHLPKDTTSHETAGNNEYEFSDSSGGQ